MNINNKNTNKLSFAFILMLLSVFLLESQTQKNHLIDSISNSYSKNIVDGGIGRPKYTGAVDSGAESKNNDENSGGGSFFLKNENSIGSKKIEHIYSTGYYKYGSFDIMNKVMEYNYLFSSFILLIFSIYILYISSNVWFKYKIRTKKKLLNNELKFQISSKDSLVELMEKKDIIKDFKKYNQDYFKDKFYKYERKITEIQDKLSLIDKEKNNYFNETITYFLIASILFISYYSLIFFVKGLPFSLFFNELINYPLEFVSPFLILSMLFSLIAFVKFILSQSNNDDKQMNKFSIFGILLAIIDLMACSITIYQFTK